MKQFFGYVVFAWLAIEQTLTGETDMMRIASLLGALCIFIVREKFFESRIASYVFLLIIAAIAFFNPCYVLLLGIPLLDMAFERRYAEAAAVFTASSAWSLALENYSNLPILAASGFIGYITGVMSENGRKNLAVLDEERRLRYSLEQAQNELINSRKEIERLTEIRERNRIAREIHDNIGHSIAGVVFQLEAAARVVTKDPEKAGGILKLCGARLAEALELMRNTVYNIRTDKKIGLELIEKMIGDFKYCPVEFEHSGDFSGLSATSFQSLEAIIMECLTNAARHSQARKIRIRLDIGRKNIRFYYRDDGRGCTSISENTGLSGMRERIRNAGGTISIDGGAGFLIVCNLPAGQEERREAEEFV